MRINFALFCVWDLAEGRGGLNILIINYLTSNSTAIIPLLWHILLWLIVLPRYLVFAEQPKLNGYSSLTNDDNKPMIIAGNNIRMV